MKLLVIICPEKGTWHIMDICRVKRSKKAKFVGKPGQQLSLEVTGLEEMFGGYTGGP